ncbi:DJ-1/PfpI family protein [Paraburkholderia pallida]|uniref:DJ-1/PfpI domain-containing protein n=1 Tax=Paraburkholderia pallida TaxID=2547399 RepID=A0A4P7CUX5_9BURK|nr:DJ-1/PfpI family protein [Paraburkholderia pallida]QBQ99087.1 hypothetical protein E1956_17815 [Paraburkholderia pallida]
MKKYRVAILAVDGFEEVELTEPQRAFKEAGIEVDVISQKSGAIHGIRHVDLGNKVNVDRTFADAQADDYDAVVLPGGVVNSGAIRLIPEAQSFVKRANASHKLIAVICHGGWLPFMTHTVSERTARLRASVARRLLKSAAACSGGILERACP